MKEYLSGKEALPGSERSRQSVVNTEPEPGPPSPGTRHRSEPANQDLALCVCVFYKLRSFSPFGSSGFSLSSVDRGGFILVPGSGPMRPAGSSFESCSLIFIVRWSEQHS